MAVGLSSQLPPLHSVPGVRLAAVEAGVRYQGRLDLALIELAKGSTVAGVFTRNAFCAAPVTLCRRHLERGEIRYWLVNSGNANAGTGRQGMVDAEACCAAVAGGGGAHAHQVLPFSTGVIGEPLPVERIRTALPAAFAALDAGNWERVARAIMTTDTVPKAATRRIDLDGHIVTVTGIAKGSGMIRPDMATMLAFIASDARVAPELLQRCLSEAADASFNRVTVDGDTSTNDSCVLAATGLSQAAPITADGPDYRLFATAVEEICRELAQMLVRDGEGATKFISVEVSGGRDAGECLDVAYTIAHSPLVKTAFFASDPNWGRILAAVGRAGLADLDLEAITIHLDDVCIVRDGGRAADYREAAGQEVMAREEIRVRVALGRGAASETVWTSDLSHEYVRINAEYRS